jgi:hypothetical protein
LLWDSVYLETGFVLVVCYQLTSFHKVAGLIGGIGHFNIAQHDIFVCKTLKKQQIVTCKNNMTHSFLKDKSSGYQQSWILELLHFTRHPWLEHFFRVLGGVMVVQIYVYCWRWGVGDEAATWCQKHKHMEHLCCHHFPPSFGGPPSLQSDLWILYYSLYYSLMPGNKVVTTLVSNSAFKKLLLFSTSYIYSWWN